jgi:hypothetical protein
MAAEKSGVIARITLHCEIFCETFYSRIDNTRLNFTLGILGMLQVEKFQVRFKTSSCH